MTRAFRLAALSALMLGLGACGEKPQQLAGQKVKGGAADWQGPAGPFTVPGWTVGDEGSWDRHLQARAQAQNEYVRLGASP